MGQSSFRAVKAPAADGLIIRGRHLEFGSLLNPRLFEREHRAMLKRQMQTARPFAHLVADDWFAHELLEAVREEFSSRNSPALTGARTTHESTYRMPLGSRLGPAAQLYFWLVNSGPFVELLGELCDVEGLLPDVSLSGGGMHETKAGGFFDVHVDFDRHLATGLRNEAVLLTYLNHNWQPEWNGALELWDDQGCAVSVQPEFGRIVLLRQTPLSLHGHPAPLTPPASITRRSLASYYYTNPSMGPDRLRRGGTAFLHRDATDRLRQTARAVVPPVLWSFVRRCMRR